MKRMTIGLFTAALLISQNIYAHGEDKLGPHNGYIRMPGAYHVEVIPAKNKLKIMLLDIHFKNPTVLNSNVKVKIQSGSEAYAVRCQSMENHFSCPVSDQLLKQKGTLKIESERQLAVGMPVEYPLPLRLKKS